MFAKIQGREMWVIYYLGKICIKLMQLKNMTYNNFKPNPKTLDKIQKYMHDNKSKFKERGKMSANIMFVFPDGEVIHIDSHKESIYIIRKNLRLKCIKGLLDLQRYGI